MNTDETIRLPIELQEQIDQADGRRRSHVRIVFLGSSIIGYLIGLYFNIWVALTLMFVCSVVSTNAFILRTEKRDTYGIQALQRRKAQAQLESPCGRVS